MTDDPKGVEVVASALIVGKDKKILLIKSHKWGDQYLLPGGHVEQDETILDAAKREGEEETGLELKPLYCVNVGELINDPTFYRKAHLIYFHIVCEAVTSEVHLDEKELKEFIWAVPEEALNLPGLARTRTQESIRNYVSGNKIKIESDIF